MSTVTLSDFESLKRFYLNNGKMLSKIELEVVNSRVFLFEREKMKLEISELESGNFLITMTAGFMTDFPKQESYVCYKADDFYEGNREDVLNNNCGWIFKEKNDDEFELDDLEYDDTIVNDECIHVQVFPSIYGVEDVEEDVSVILNIWKSEEPKEKEEYIFALEVGSLISLYEGYLVC